MALDMLVDATQLDSALTSVADAIRAKGGTSAQLAFPAGFVSAIQAIPTGGGGSGWGEVFASGTVQGSGSHVLDIVVGSRCPSTNFLVYLMAQEGSEYEYSSTYKFASQMAFFHGDLCHFGSPTGPAYKKTYTIIDDRSYDVNNAGTVTQANIKGALGSGTTVRNGAYGNRTQFNSATIIAEATGVSLELSQGNANYPYPTTISYDWVLIYFGDDIASESISQL